MRDVKTLGLRSFSQYLCDYVKVTRKPVASMLWPPAPAQCARGYIRTSQKLRLRPQYAARAAAILRRHYASEVDIPNTERKSLVRVASARYNEIGVQQLSDYVHPQVFPS